MNEYKAQRSLQMTIGQLMQVRRDRLTPHPRGGYPQAEVDQLLREVAKDIERLLGRSVRNCYRLAGFEICGESDPGAIQRAVDKASIEELRAGCAKLARVIEDADGHRWHGHATSVVDYHLDDLR